MKIEGDFGQRENKKIHLPILRAGAVGVKSRHALSHLGRGPTWVLQVVSERWKLAIQPSATRFWRPSSAVGRERVVRLRASRMRDDLNMVEDLYVLAVYVVLNVLSMRYREYGDVDFASLGKRRSLIMYMENNSVSV